MAGYVHVRSRRQVGLPACLDDAIATDSLARVVDAFVASADLRALGFARAGAADVVDAGRPSFDPAALAGLLLYGHRGHAFVAAVGEGVRAQQGGVLVDARCAAVF